MMRIARSVLESLSLVALFVPFALAVFCLAGAAGGPGAAQGIALLALLILPVWGMRRLRLVPAPERVRDAYD